MIGGCILYSYAFFYCQPDRSFETLKRQNDELILREKLRREQLQAQRNGHDLDVVPEVPDAAPEWQRKMRATSAGDLAWKREQEQLAAAGHSYLRGNHNNDTGSGNRRRKRNGGEALLDFILMFSVFVLTRTILRACLFYRQFHSLLRAQGDGGGGMSTPLSIPPSLIPTTTNNNTNTTTRSRSTTRTTSRSNSGRAALARLMVPQSIHYATLLRNARFRAWVNDLNQQRAQHGQPPLSMDTLRLMMRDSDFSSNDYEALMRFHEEATLAQSMGATQAEIERCPKRTLVNLQDELLFNTTPDHHHHHHVPSAAQECSICLEKYQLQDQVRRIPCFHEFHVHCIDPWLAQKAVCPVCKHPVVG